MKTHTKNLDPQLTIDTSQWQFDQRVENRRVVMVGYFPVIHRGYLMWIQAVQPDEILVFDDTVLAEHFDALKRKDLRRLPAVAAAAAIPPALTAFDTQLSESDVSVLVDTTPPSTQDLANTLYVFADEDIHHFFVNEVWQLSAEQQEQSVQFHPVKLRYDKSRATQDKKVHPDHTISKQEFDSQIITQLTTQAQQSEDWWRQVAAVAIDRSKQEILSAVNHHLPDEYQPVMDGDPRGIFSAGKEIDKSTAQHAEASLVAQAAQQGISLRDTEIYVTTFPCPTCAKLLAETGISKLYYQDGYATVDGDTLLRSAGIELVHIAQN